LKNGGYESNSIGGIVNNLNLDILPPHSYYDPLLIPYLTTVLPPFTPKAVANVGMASG
jgi:hypothetical protein